MCSEYVDIAIGSKKVTSGVFTFNQGNDNDDMVFKGAPATRHRANQGNISIQSLSDEDCRKKDKRNAPTAII